MSRTRDRDRGLSFVSSATRWTAAGAAALSGAFALVAAHPHLPKLNLRPQTDPTSPVDDGGYTQYNQGGGLQPASQAPAASAALPRVNSGGS